MPAIHAPTHPAAAHFALALAAYLLARAAAGLVYRRHDPVRAASALHTVTRVGYVAAVGATAGVATTVETGEYVADHLAALAPGVTASGIYGTLAAAVVFLGPVFATALAVRLATVPAHDRLGLRGGYRLATRRFAARYLTVVLPAIVLVGLAEIAPPGWPTVAAVAVGSLALAVLSPLALALLLRARRPTPAERTRLARLADSDVPVYVVARDTPAGLAFAAGVVPGLRTVFVTERLLATLPDRTLDGVLAHEEGHLRRGHLPLRFTLPWLYFSGWFAAVEFGLPHALVGGVVLSVPVLYAVVRVIWWTEYDADAYAARTAGPDAVADALRTLTRHYGAPLDDGYLRRVVSRHPPIRERLARLDARESN